MRQATALLLGVLLPLLGLSGIGNAQSAVQLQGTIQAVDCQAQTIVVSGPGGTNTVPVAPNTPVLVNSTSVPFCALQQYIGAPASVWLAAYGNEFVATRIDVVGEAAVVPPPYVAPVEEVSADPLPIVGIVLGTIAVAGLIFLLTHDRDDHYYRYPYYGSYYRYYYRPEYRPYFGWYPGQPPIITRPAIIGGFVLGTTVVGGLEYLVTRDRDGRFYRYPYYGPYRTHYYRPDYRPYGGPYRDAPVRQVDPRWEPPAYRNVNNAPVNNYHPNFNAPVNQGGPQRWTPPANQNAPVINNHPNFNAPVNQGGPQRWTPPANQNAPVINNHPNFNAPVNQGGPRRDAPAYRQPSQGQGCQGRDQSCGGRETTR
ncbi:MAG TPA: hypothetical protein VFP86_01045 [bacterium]|nr:hypothetical protein [bacterium]